VETTISYETARWDGTGWRDLHSPPPQEAHGGMAYDPVVGKTIVMVGAVTGIPLSMWGWDGTVWTQIFTPTVPPDTNGSVLLAFDGAHQNLVLFDSPRPGATSTWIFDGHDWTRSQTQTSPPPRDRATITYDASRRDVVLYGGVGSAGLTPLNDTWVWDGQAWTERSPTVRPMGAAFASLAYDPTAAEDVLVEGKPETPGMNQGGPVSWWKWNGTTWTSLGTAPMPLGSMTFDTRQNQMVLVPAIVGMGQPAPNPLQQTWISSNGHWQHA
jgi:hypothetical protein